MKWGSISTKDNTSPGFPDQTWSKAVVVRRMNPILLMSYVEGHLQVWVRTILTEVCWTLLTILVLNYHFEKQLQWIVISLCSSGTKGMKWIINLVLKLQVSDNLVHEITEIPKWHIKLRIVDIIKCFGSVNLVPDM